MMKRFALLCAVLVGLALGQWAPSSLAQTTTVKTLVLYDNPSDPSYGRLGQAYAIMLRNLLGHFNTTIDMMRVEDYTAGKLGTYDATFYLGAYYDNPLPQSFLADVAQTTKTVVWMKYNLWKLAWDPLYGFTGKFGFNFSGLRGLDAAPSPANPNPGFFDTVLYKGQSMVKYYAYNAQTGVVNADPEIGGTQIVDPVKAQAPVMIQNSRTAEQLPYIVRSGNLWYFADMPFSYIGPRDRYLVAADILHDILGTNVTQNNHRAMVRLEDVSALTTYASMKSLTDELRTRNIKFGIATIPFYRDPLGEYNNGVPQEVHLNQATALKQSLNYAKARGGRIVMHGYTHQYGSMRNPWSGVSGDDFEFWDIVNNRPVNEDSTVWAAQRLQAGLSELGTTYAPFAWEAPHYHSSPLSIKAVPPKFAKTWQRVVYYTSDNPNLNPTNPNQVRDFAVGQFFPYIIKQDYYGQRVLPENLGNIEYDISGIDPSSNFNYTWQDLCTNASYGKVIRDGFAAFFFHPFWLEPTLPPNVTGLADFKKVLDCVATQYGYTWVDPSTVQ